ncbi:MAG: triphosphoribosyl-dephospho-CoA synthase [Spirochaeta sp.]|nr:triphosphoribosyl-dephospho-CoA synthase [Spirochaeta sp.]
MAAHLARLVDRAMRAELATTPKPGLVDAVDSGAHRDMCFGTFTRSIDAVAPLFFEIAAIACGETPTPGLFSRTRHVGRSAEAAMFTATGGINTHKGQIFVLVLLTTACAALGAQTVTLPRLRDAVQRMTHGIVDRELAALDAGDGHACRQLTHGEALHRKYGVSGIRGEAETGFPAIFEVAVPVFTATVLAGGTRNDGAVQALLHLMAVVEDTTVLYRGGPQAMETMRRHATVALGLGGIMTGAGRRYLQEMNRHFVNENISPGGCADLLAGTLFVISAVDDPWRWKKPIPGSPAGVPTGHV